MAETLLQIVDRKNQRIEDVPERFQSSVEKLQSAAFDRIVILISQLDTTSDGMIEISQPNLIKVEAINEQLKTALSAPEYLNAVRAFVTQFEVQKEINDEYFNKAFGDDFEETGIANQLIRNSQINTISLLAGVTAEQALSVPVKAQLEQAVSSGASLADTLAAVKVTIEGDDDVDGRMLRYSKQVSWDLFAIADRVYTNSLAEDLDIEWFRYSGGIVQDSRCFCVERDRDYFHFKEIEAFGRGEDISTCNNGGGTWQGQMPGTNESTIFIVAGGFNCRHTWSPVSISIVPRDVILRNIDSGNFVPTAFEKKELKL